MKTLEKAVQSWNFKKIALWYVVAALAIGLICAGTLVYLYGGRLNFAWQYAQIEKAKSEDALCAAAQKVAESSSDVVDVLLVDENGRVTYSAKQSVVPQTYLEFNRSDANGKYYTSPEFPQVAFRAMKSSEFMLSSIINKDFGQIKSDYDDDSAFDTSLNSKSVYMVSKVTARLADTGKEDHASNVGSATSTCAYVITMPTSVPGGMMALKASAVIAMLFFCIYWVLVALWLYRDASKCKLSALSWGVIGLLTNLVGLVVYKIYKKSLAVCPACGSAQSSGHRYCSACGTQLGVQCEKCGCKVGEKDAFCHQCGSKID